MPSSLRPISASSIALAALVAAATAAAAAPQAAGQVVTIAPNPDGSATIAGWACQTDNPVPVQVHLYVGDPYPAGQIVTSATANEQSPAANCGAGGTRHGFTLRLGPEVLFRYGGLQLFANAILPNHAGNPPIDAPASATLPAWIPIGSSPRTCDISDFASLKRCVDQATQFDQMSLRQDLTCTSEGECCGADHGALIRLKDVTRRVFEGNGHRIHRPAGARECRAIGIIHSSDILIRNLSLDESESVPPCELSNKDCASTIDINQSHNVRVDNTHIYFGKGYVVRAWGTDGFAFVHSSVSESGIIGLYVGHYKLAPSKNIVIADSIFAHTRTNGIALQGTYGTESSPVLIIDNIFTRNHWHGLWPVPGVSGGITTGGQVLIADGANVRFADNIIAEATCGNCYPPGQTVGGVEIGDDPHPPAGVANLSIDHNYVYADAGIAFGQNPATPVSGVSMENNRVAGKLRIEMLATAVTRNHNVQEPTVPPARSLITLSLAPRPGAPTTPIYRCLRGNAEVFALTLTCDGNGQVQAVLGFSYEPNNPGARPLFACQPATSSNDQTLSLDPKCGSGRTIAQLGFAVSE